MPSEACCGYRIAKWKRLSGWRLHLAGVAANVPVTGNLLPVVEHDLIPIYELAVNLSTGQTVCGDDDRD